jgi:hypothetical protein
MFEPPNPEPKRTVGAPADHRNCRLVETLYKTKIPETTAWADHFFELTLGEETIHGKLAYFVRETHCRWDAAARHTVRVQYTLSPRGGFATIEEAHERYKQQRTARAQHGFVHSYAPSYEAATQHRKYVRIEVAPRARSEEKV